MNNAKIFETIVENRLKKFKIRRKIKTVFKNIKFENLLANQDFDIFVNFQKTSISIVTILNI